MKKVQPTPKHVITFTHGDCWILAEEISNLTGWQSCAFDDGDGPDIHAFVRTPTGTYLDIHGEDTEEGLRDRWDSYDTDIIDCDYFEDDGWTQQYPGSQKLAKVYAVALAEAYNHNNQGA